MQDHVKLLISPQTDLRQTIKVIDQGAPAQIAFIIDESQGLIGTVTDGDIRRGLLRGVTLESPVEQVMNKKFRFVREGVREQDVLLMMRKEFLHQIPMLDSEGRVCICFCWKNCCSKRLCQPKS